MIGANDERGAGEREKRRLRADKYFEAIAGFSLRQKRDQFFLAVEIGK